MDLLETLKILLDNEKLMEEYNYSAKDVKRINLKEEHENDFIRFMQIAVRLMTNEDDTERQIVNRLIKAFE